MTYPYLLYICYSELFNLIIYFHYSTEIIKDYIWLRKEIHNKHQQTMSSSTTTTTINNNATTTTATTNNNNEEITSIPTSTDPLVSSPPEIGFTSLLTQLQNSALNLKPVVDKYHAFRRVRGDGNCFFRCFMFRLAEICFDDKIQLARIQSIMKSSMTELLLPAAYERVAVETFYEMVCEFWIDELPTLKNKQELDVIFNDFGSSEHLVWFARVLAAAYLKRNPERFEPFLPAPYVSIQAYCSSEVEPQGKECEELEINALCDVLEWPVIVEYISAKTHTTSTFGPSLNPGSSSTIITPICLLYRPGHYDILYT
jgi:ubiquitin thioesterase protein OTUB1